MLAQICLTRSSFAQSTGPVIPPTNLPAVINPKCIQNCYGSSTAPAAAPTNSNPAANACSVDSSDICQKAMNHAATLCLVSGPGSDPNLQATMNQASTLANAMNTSTDQAQACKSAADLAGLMAAVNSAKGGACETGIIECYNACDADKNSVNSILTKINNQSDPTTAVDSGCSQVAAKRKLATISGFEQTCNSYQAQAVSALSQMIASGVSYMQNNACANALSVTPTPFPDPTDCTDPYVAASSITCICQANPNDTMCPNAQAISATLPANATSSVSGPGSGSSPYNNSLAIATATPLPTAPPTPQTAAAGVQPPVGGGGFGNSGPTAPVAPGGDENGAGGPSGIDKNVITGTGSGGAGGGLNSAPVVVSGADKPADQAKGFFDRFNLSKFLPNKKDYKNRGLAGMSVPSKDGVTGPMGPTIWEKVSNQYQQQKPKLIQDR